jgi:hypothetical protein
MNRQISRWFCFATVVSAVGVILVTACSPAALTQVPPTPTQVLPTPTMGPVDVVKAYEDAFNRHDVQGTMAWLTEDVSFLVPSWGNMELKTRQDVQKLHEFYLAGPIEVHYTDCQTSANTVTCKTTYAEACSRAFGINVVPGVAVFTMLNDKIQTIKWDLTSDESNQYSENFDKFFSWWEKTYPDEFKWSQTDDNWLTKENGAILAKRCQEYGATIK